MVIAFMLPNHQHASLRPDQMERLFCPRPSQQAKAKTDINDDILIAMANFGSEQALSTSEPLKRLEPGLIDNSHPPSIRVKHRGTETSFCALDHVAWNQGKGDGTTGRHPTDTPSPDEKDNRVLDQYFSRTACRRDWNPSKRKCTKQFRGTRRLLDPRGNQPKRQ